MKQVNINEIMNSFKEIANQVSQGENTARKVSEQLVQKASELHAMADSLTLLARSLNGGCSESEPVGKKTVVLKSKEDERQYKQSKSKKPKGRVGAHPWSKEQREAAAERMRKMHAERKAEAEKRAMLMKAVEQ